MALAIADSQLNRLQTLLSSYGDLGEAYGSKIEDAINNMITDKFEKARLYFRLLTEKMEAMQIAPRLTEPREP